MGITNEVPSRISLLLTNNDPDLPQYMNLGTSVIAASRGDTTMVNDGSTFIDKGLSGGSSAGVGFLQALIPSTSKYGRYTEFGTLDGTTGTKYLYERSISDNEVYHGNTVNTRITRFSSIAPKDNAIKKIISFDFIKKLGAWFGLNTFTEPSHIAWGTYKKVDDFGTTGADFGGANNFRWDHSPNATQATTGTANFKEGTADMKMGKDGVGNTAAIYGRTLPATLDLSNAEDTWIWVNPDDADDFAKLGTSALELRLGSSVADYKKKVYAQWDLITGWQRLKLDLDNDMIEVGTPDMSAIKHLSIMWGTKEDTDTITHGNLLADAWIARDDLNYEGTTVIDEIIREEIGTLIPQASRATYKENLAKAVGNPNSLAYVRLFNASSGGSADYSNEGIEIKKDSNVQIITEVNIDTNIKDE